MVLCFRSDEESKAGSGLRAEMLCLFLSDPALAGDAVKAIRELQA